MMGAKSHADELSGPAEPSLPHQQAVDMTAPETFTTAPRQPLTKGRRPDMAAIFAHRTAGVGRVEVWRGDVRPSMSVSAPFVWRCLSGSTVAPFPHPAHRTGRADFPHPALGQDLTLSIACDAIGDF